MTTDPGDLVLDPTCGSGTTAYVAEQWGRRWITIDTSRVALALARARLMGARYPYYVLADSPEGQKKEAELSQRLPSTQPTYGNIRQGFVYERVPHITLKSIANNAEIDVIWERYAAESERLRSDMPHAKFAKPAKEETLRPLRTSRESIAEEWEVPFEAPSDWTAEQKAAHAAFMKLKRERQAAIDKSIAAKAEFEYLYDKPCTDSTKVRVAGPFTIESLSPYRTMIVDENDDLRDPLVEGNPVEDYKDVQDFAQMILSELRKSGVQQSDRKNRISFDYLEPMPGRYVSAEGRYARGGKMVKAGIFIGPEFGTVSRADLVAALREAKMLGLDELISCAFSYEASVGDLEFPGMPLLKARMNADLHMAGELKSTGSGNLFVIFGEPDIEVVREGEMIRVKIKGVDIFNPQTGKVTSSEAKDIACWFVDTEYNEESFFVRQAYFLGQKDPYQALRDTLKAEIDAEAWESIHSDISRPFPVPSTGRIAVKIINHLGDEVMKVFRV
jgi:adenine-specific DNA-methyltransferase